jgi:dTDP-4-amino-4,6-dideoxy-D-galactose acyltransferase
MDTAPCRFLDWDSRFFGRRIGKVTVTRLERRTMDEIVAWRARYAIDCLYLLADPADPTTVRLAERQRFRLVDLRVTLARNVDRPPDSPDGGPAVIRPFRPDDVPALRAIARISHRDSRFYHDGTFSPSQCGALYETWIENSCHGYADHVLVADVQDRAVGYVSCHLRDAALGQIGLFAVASEAQGKRVGQSLAIGALRWFAGQRRREVSVVTQGRNAAAQRLYQRCGFLTSAVELWYHGWSTAGTDQA